MSSNLPPIKPSEADCCNSGCNPCILDVYEEQLRKFQTTQSCNHKNCISPTSYTIFTLKSKKNYSETSALLTFSLKESPSTTEEVQLTWNPGQHFLLKATKHGESFTRAYTPIKLEENLPNDFSIVVKYVEKGKMTSFLQKLNLGNETLWRGPYGDFTVNFEFKNIVFLAQGTGITPIFNLIQEIVSNDECFSILKLFFCCGNFVFLRDQLYELQAYWNFNYEIFLGDNSTDLSVKYKEVIRAKRLDFEDIKKCLLGKERSQVILCGSASFTRSFSEFIRNNELAEDVYIF